MAQQTCPPPKTHRLQVHETLLFTKDMAWIGQTGTATAVRACPMLLGTDYVCNVHANMLCCIIRRGGACVLSHSWTYGKGYAPWLVQRINTL